MHPEQRVLAVAGRQQGCISSAQLLDAGLSRRAIAHRVSRGWLVRRHRGVYLVGPLEAPLSRAMAAVLAVGDGALLSHRSAAAVWELAPVLDDLVDVTLPGREARHRAGIRVHETRDLAPEDATVHRGLPADQPRPHPARRGVHQPAARSRPRNRGSPAPRPDHPRRAHHLPHPPPFAPRRGDAPCRRHAEHPAHPLGSRAALHRPHRPRGPSHARCQHPRRRLSVPPCARRRRRRPCGPPCAPGCRRCVPCARPCARRCPPRG